MRNLYLQSYEMADVLSWLKATIENGYQGYIKIQCSGIGVKKIFLLDIEIKPGDNASELRKGNIMPGRPTARGKA